MAIGTPVFISSPNFSSATTITTTAAAPPGSLILVPVQGGTVNEVFSALTCTDNATGGSNSYSLVASSPATANASIFPIALLACIGSTHNLPSGSTITIAGTNSANAFPGVVSAAGCNGGLDKSAINSSTSATSTSLSSGALAFNNEMVIAFLVTNGFGTFTGASGFTRTETSSFYDFAYHMTLGSAASVTDRKSVV